MWHAIKRGDLPADSDPTEVVRSLGAPFYYRMLVTHETIDEAMAEQAAAAVIAAAKAGAFRVR